jgi:hypothetical protein
MAAVLSFGKKGQQKESQKRQASQHIRGFRKVKAEFLMKQFLDIRYP